MKEYLVNFNNYGDYVELVQTGFTKVFTHNITLENLDNHFFSILNILRDGIEEPFVHDMKLEVVFEDNEIVHLTIFDYFFNLIFWKLPLCVKQPLTSEYIFFEENLTRQSIKRYIDSKFLDKHRTSFPNIELNNFIDDVLYKFMYIDEFHAYLLNTINNEDTIMLMNSNETFYNDIHADLSNVPLADVKNIGMDYTNEAIKMIKNSSHCLADSFRAGEGINTKQFKEFMINIGSKPDGNGGVFNGIINSSYSNGGVNSVASYLIDDSVARIAEILKKENVGDSGHFSRKLGLNNIDTRLHPDPEFVCNTKNLQKVEIKNSILLDMFKNRWYRFKMNGPEYCMSSNPIANESHLIGQTLYFRSPIKCASHTHGKGVCYRCYGNLAYTNNDINIGKIAAEILCAILTQMLLSAKHLLESLVIALKWKDGFLDLFDVNFNIINIKEELPNIKKYKLIIDPEMISQENEEDSFEYNDYITSFNVLDPDGNIITMNTENADNIYISKELTDIISKEDDPVDGEYMISFDRLKDTNLFLVKISNNELSQILEDVKRLVDKIINVASHNNNTDSWLQSLLETILDAGLDVDSVHCEILLANQVRNTEDILDKPYWEYPNEQCNMITLTQSLTNHPNISTALEFQKLPKTLYSPLSFKKTQAAPIDLFFMTRPQAEMDIYEEPEFVDNSPKPLMKPIHRMKK